jgi:ATP-dependent DNA helicase DinG
MFTKDNRQKAHEEIDYIFKSVLPAYRMPERPAQIALSHHILDAMLDGQIALCDAGTGIGKTFAYLVAGTVLLRCRAASGLPFRPVLISTSSIALQKSVRDEYLPLLSAALRQAGIVEQPLNSVIRKGKAHYVCDKRLNRRLREVEHSKKNKQAVAALHALKKWLDMDAVPDLNGYDRDRVCVPAICDCDNADCRYLAFLASCENGQHLFQICNHNLLLADAMHRSGGRRPLLPEPAVLVIDEAHKLPETARLMFGVTLTGEDMKSAIHSLQEEHFLLASESLAEAALPLMDSLAQPYEGVSVAEYSNLLEVPQKVLKTVQKQLHTLVTPVTENRLNQTASAVSLFRQGAPGMLLYAAEDGNGGTMLCATVSDLTAQLRGTLWKQPQPIILTSGTMAVGSDFHRFKADTGLLNNQRVTESVSLSPFDYQKNCLLYLPKYPPHRGQAESNDYYEKLTDEIAALLHSACGHALVLFTSYAAMSAVKERLRSKHLPYRMFTMSRNALHTVEQFKKYPGSVLLATGAAWEGFDFPGDCVSLLIIPRLPFAHPDAVKEKKRDHYETLRAFIRAVVVPEMQIKLRQGFGRAIRTETDTCVVAILDERVATGGRYYRDMLAALPTVPITSSLQAVERFLREVKTASYFVEEFYDPR